MQTQILCSRSFQWLLISPLLTPSKQNILFTPLAVLQWKRLVEEGGLNSYSWYRQYTLECRLRPEVN